MSELYEGWRRELIERQRRCVEAAIDFSDEADVASEAVGQARGDRRGAAGAIAAHLDDGHRGEILREGFQRGARGPAQRRQVEPAQRAGPARVAIVSEEAGTTRDVIEVRLDLERLPVVVTDTAGIREPQGKVERRASGARWRSARRPTWSSG